MVLVATWRDGLFVLAGETLDQELRNQPVSALAPDGGGGALAIVNGRSLHRRAPQPDAQTPRTVLGTVPMSLQP